MSNQKTEIQDYEIDILELIKVLWEDKLRIIAITAIAAFISLIYALSQPNIYQAEALIAAAGEESGRGMSNIANQFGGLASLAGISLPNGGVKKSDLGLEVIKSRKFVREFVEHHKILPQLMAVDYWDPNTQELVLDTDKYDKKTKAWLGEDGTPTNEKVYEKYNSILILEKDNTSEFIRIGFKHKSPHIAAEWTSMVIKDLNDAIRRQDINEAESSIAYLREQIEASPLTDLKKLFYNIIQSQTETMMLANVREEYVFKTIDPATIPEFKSEPKRAIICFLGTIIGGLIAVIYVIIRHYTRPLKS